MTLNGLRDNGIGSYNQVRVAYGLPAVTSFAQITSNVTVQQELKAVYGNVNNIDPFEGGMAEDHVAGSDLGPLFTKILVDQFTRLMDGDRFFYKNESFNREELKILQQSNTLTKAIEANTHITNMQSDAFVFHASISGKIIGKQVNGITVLLDDGDGNVVSTTTTDKHGNYVFGNIDGVGDYTIVVDLPSGSTLDSHVIEITRGGVNIRNVNFKISHQAKKHT